jgi:hypothetical protein
MIKADQRVAGFSEVTHILVHPGTNATWFVRNLIYSDRGLMGEGFTFSMGCPDYENISWDKGIIFSPAYEWELYEVLPGFLGDIEV